MVGGAPITQEFADEIGADGYSEDAASAATLAKRISKIIVLHKEDVPKAM